MAVTRLEESRGGSSRGARKMYKRCAGCGTFTPIEGGGYRSRCAGCQRSVQISAHDIRTGRIEAMTEELRATRTHLDDFASAAAIAASAAILIALALARSAAVITVISSGVLPGWVAALVLILWGL